MKELTRIYVALSLLICALPAKAQQTYRTSSTVGDHAGKWTKIATIEITTRFLYSNNILELNGGNHANYSGTAKLFFRVKQQAVFPNAPYIQLELLESNNGPLQTEHFMAVLTNSAGAGYKSSHIGELYVRIIHSYEAISFVPTHKFEVETAIFHENQPFVDALPVGAQFPAKPNLATRLHVHHTGNDGKFLSESGQPGFILKEKDGPTDENWWIDNNNGRFRLLTADDDMSSWQTALFVDQESGTPTEIHLNAKVGIGTTNPQAKLAVNGDIRATKIKVLADVNAVPDYVFEEDYELQSLEEVEAYVKEHSHLPEVPSAQEMSEEGHDLGKMNLLLLKKIEELTLHVIELQKENQRQDQVIKKLLPEESSSN